MALFFDKSWFNERLAAVGLSRANIAAALGLTDSELAEVWKDQREEPPMTAFRELVTEWAKSGMLWKG